MKKKHIDIDITSMWIHVDHKLPPPNKKVLLYTKREFISDDNVIKGWYSKRYKMFQSAECHEDEEIFPTHWRPLPTKPNGWNTQ